MSNRRSIIIAVAVVFAAIAFIGTLLYLKGADDRAYGKAKLVDVYVVKQEIKKGTTGEQVISDESVVLSRIPQQYHPGTAILTLDDLRGKVALTDLAVDQVVVSGQFVNPEQAAGSFSQRIPDGQVAVTIMADQVHAVAGFIAPGDKVNVLAYGKDPNDAKSDKMTTRVIYQNVNVIAVGSATTPDLGQTAAQTTATTAAPAAVPVPPSLITLAVPLDAAQRIIIPASGANGTVIYLTLVPPSAQPVVPVPGVVDSNNAYNPPSATPYR